MGIRVKNLQNYVYTLRAPGAITAAANKDCCVIHFNGWISNVYAKQSVAGSGSTTCVVDIHNNGTTIFATSVKITCVATTGVISYSTLSSQPYAVTAGDILSLDVDQTHAGGSPANFVAKVTVTRTGMGEESNVADSDNVL